MFLSKTNACLKSKFLVGYVDNYNHNNKRGKELLCMLKKTCSYSVYANAHTNQLCFALCYDENRFRERDSSSEQIKGNLIHLLNVNRQFCTKSLPKKANVFGDLAYEKYEKFEMDEAEEAEERYTENDAKIPKWQKLSPGQYANLIKDHIGQGDLELALSVLDLVKQNRDKPTVYMYSLLIRAFALQGDLKQCFKLYNRMKKRQLVPNAAIYNSLINSCAICRNTEKALEHLHSLRQFFIEKNYDLNEIHYITLIKAYSWHKQIATAFEIADEARDKGLTTGDIFAVLFHAAISNKENGCQYALVLWHKMRRNKITPNLTHYNLLLRAIKDTKFGDMTAKDNAISKLLRTEIQIDEQDMPDLLEFPPKLSTSILTLNQQSLQNTPGSMSNDNNSNMEIVDRDEALFQCLNKTLKQNPLVLFGGIEKLLNRMKKDNVEPNIKTATMLLELIPCSLAAETFFLRYLEDTNIKLDITFFNTLIKKRCLRSNYKAAKDVLYEVQRRHLMPDVLTFGALAIGCTKLEDGEELLEQMYNIRFVPNETILNTLLNTAAFHKNLEYVSFLMNYMLARELSPSKLILSTLDNYKTSMLKFMKTKNRYNRKEVKKIQNDYNQFLILYNEWKEKMERDDIIKTSRSTINNKEKRKQ